MPKIGSKKCKDDLKRNVFTLAEKMRLIEAVKKGKEEGKSRREIAEEVHVSSTTLDTIWFNRNKIEKRISESPSTKTTTLSAKHCPLLETMEDKLYIWLHDQGSHGAVVDGVVLQMKALEIHNSLCRQLGINYPFKASQGWLKRFKNRKNISFKKTVGEAAAVDLQVVKLFVENFEKKIIDQSYHLDQIFNVDELGLFWNKQPSHTYTTKKKNPSGHKESKKRITLLIGGNASGTLKLKPMFIHKYKNPRDMAGINREALPVIFEANKSAWMTTKLFRWWFQSYFGPAVMSYLKSQGREEKALLVLDNAPAHPTDLEYPGIEIVFMPPNTSMVLQPMDQCAIKTFKSYFTRNMLRTPYLTSQVGRVKAFHSVKEYQDYWKNMKIISCIEQVDKAWTEVKNSTMAKSWRQLLPNLSYTSPTNDEEPSVLTDQQTAAADIIGFTLNQPKDLFDVSSLSCTEIGFLSAEFGIPVPTLESENKEDDNIDETAQNSNTFIDSQVVLEENSQSHSQKELYYLLDNLSRSEMKEVIVYLTNKL